VLAAVRHVAPPIIVHHVTVVIPSILVAAMLSARVMLPAVHHVLPPIIVHQAGACQATLAMVMVDAQPVSSALLRATAAGLQSISFVQ
jgi:hypothetical protein